jgi:2-desacetyl-2-hydroxyethyl bacteriochlorophyllide A dehydrogenase
MVDPGMKRTSVVFQSPFHIDVAADEVPEPGPGEVLVQVGLSAVSAGTELLVYRGQVPADMPLDSNLPALTGAPRFPLRYGYAAAGGVTAVGRLVDPAWRGRRVFCFHPHASHLVAAPAELIPIPDDVETRDAVSLATMETAVTLMMDGHPAIGERVVVFGQGVVGLLATALLSRYPLKSLFGVDPFPRRRDAARVAGAHAVFDTADPEVLKDRLEEESGGTMADLVFELSGNPQTLDAAIATAGFASRIIIGSWYGTKPTSVNLGGKFHRSRIRLISSQVSTLPHEFLARWTTARRLATAWDMIRCVKPSRFITHEFPVEKAAEAYALLDQRPSETAQVVLTYPG